MGKLIIVEPMVISAVTSNRGTGAANLLTPDPKEVWADATVGSAATLTLDLGSVRMIDTILLGHVRPPAADAIWSITRGIAGPSEAVLQGAIVLRVPDVANRLPPLSHALWTGAAVAARYLAISVTQPAGATALTAGVALVGKAFVADLSLEWGAGRQPIDTGNATDLPSGGFGIVEGARKRSFSWTFGDLSLAEADELDMIAEGVGESRPVLVVEDPDRTAGLRSRVHYGLFARFRAFERRNRKQTRWELEVKEWV